jgi:hypothetical protein
LAAAVGVVERREDELRGGKTSRVCVDGGVLFLQADYTR